MMPWVGLNDITAILSFSPDALEIDDPFREDQRMHVRCIIHHLDHSFIVDGRSITSFGAES